MPQKTASKNEPPRRGRTEKRSVSVRFPNARTSRRGPEDEEVLPSGGSNAGVAYGRCGGRVLGSLVEQQICDMLSRHGITHSHSPRHFEVRLDETRVAASAPQIVLRGRGREGKTVVIEAFEALDQENLRKIRAFRSQYGSEFYVCFVAPEETLEDMPLDAYDEAAATTEAHTLITRLAE